jgi:DnaK suppressor protein
MTNEERKYLEDLLHQEIAKTSDKIETLVELCKPIAPENAIGRITRMDAINNKTISEAGLRQAEGKMQQLKLALIRINEENFGNCRRCGNPIQPRRLVLMPQSPFCVSCAQNEKA